MREYEEHKKLANTDNARKFYEMMRRLKEITKRGQLSPVSPNF